MSLPRLVPKDAAGSSREVRSPRPPGMSHEQPRLRELPSGSTIVAGNAGDHSPIVSLLVQVYQSPLEEDFQSRVDEPTYTPSDRLLVKREGQVIGHVQVARHVGWFQGQRLPLVKLQDFAMLPEYRCSPIESVEYDAALLKMAETTAANEGAILGLIRTDQPEWFEQHGWSCCRGQGHTRASTMAILSHFDAQLSQRRRVLRGNRPTIEVRTWRHFELDCLRRIYEQVVTGMWGPLHRSEEAWQWLIGRKAHDQILLAIDRSQSGSSTRADRHAWTEDEAAASESWDVWAEDADDIGSLADICDPKAAIGYAVVRDSCIVEMFTLPGYEAARSLLISRACRDAIDRDHHFVSLHTPAADPMHELLVTAGGSWIRDTADSSGQWMLKLLAPEKWVEKLYPILHERARESGLPRPFEFGVAADDATYRLSLTRRSSRLQHGKLPHGQLHCTWHTFQDLLASNLTFPEATAQGRLETTQAGTAHALASLFPPKLFWQSPFESLWLS